MKDTASETKTNADPKSLKITLALADNPDHAHAVLTIANTGKEAFPATGWKLFFNVGDLKTADTTLATIRQVNGDLFFLQPGSGFKELQPGDSAAIAVSGNPIRNKTDVPSGFYMVDDQTPGKGLPMAVETKAGSQFEQANELLAAKIFDQNAVIKPVADEKLVKIFPTPVSYLEKGQPFLLDGEVVIITDQDFQREAALLANELATIIGKKPGIQTQGSGKAVFLRKKQGLAAEGYELSVSPEKILIAASSDAGIFYGIQSLKTVMPAAAFSGKAGLVKVPGMEVKDAPRFGYRALMMDVARNFQSKAEVLKVLDVLALYKMNTFHFHFSEDEGWRVEIPSLPELTTVGSNRSHTADSKTSLYPSYGSGPDTSNPAGTGFYSKADFVEMLRYAHDRHIDVIPEIESPGHARAAIKAMDARYDRLTKEGKKEEAEKYLLRDLNDQSVYRSVQGWDDNVINVAVPSVYAFMERVVDDLMGMYQEAGAPLKTIHFGGDEVPAGVWEKSPAVQKLMGENQSVKTPDDLWYYYFGRINQLLKARHLFLSGWEEIGLKKTVQNGEVSWVPNQQFVPEHFRVNVWKNSPGSGAEDLAYRMANAGYQVILTGVTHFYLDLAYNPSSEERGQYWGGYVDIEKPFYFIPYDYLRNLKEDNNGNPINRSLIKGKESLTAKGKANIVGIESPLWAETNRTPQQFEYKILPKLLGVAERAWAKDPTWATEKDLAKSGLLYNQAWSEFVTAVGTRELPRLDFYAGGYGYRIPTAGAKIIDGKLAANVQFPGFLIHYTTDGTEPTAQSPVYTKPIASTGMVKFKVFNAAGRAGQTVTVTTQSLLKRG